MNPAFYKPLPVGQPPPRDWVDQQERLKAHDAYAMGGGNWANPINPENKFGVEKGFWPWYYGPDEAEYALDSFYNPTTEEPLEDEEVEYLFNQVDKLDRSDTLVPEMHKKDCTH